MRWTTGVALVAFAAAASDASAGDPSVDVLADDLLARFGSWDGCDGWYSANRWTLLRLSYRATPVAAGAARPVDVAARDRARAALTAALTAKDGFVASEAALALGLAGDARDIPVLARVLTDRSATLRMLRCAALGLGALPRGDAAQAAAARDALLGALTWNRREELVSFWATCGYSIAMRGDASVVPRLVDLRQSILEATTGRQGFPVPDEATAALTYAVGALGGEDLVSEVERYLRERQPPEIKDTMCGVAHALARVPGDKSLALLREMAVDNLQPVRCVALQALGSAAGPKDEASLKLLRQALASERDVNCRQMAAIGLARSGAASAGAVLAAALERGPGSDKRFVGVALGLWLRRSPDPKLAASLARAFEEAGTPDDRSALAIACGLAGVKDATKAIVAEVPKGRGGPMTSGACCALGLFGAGPAEIKLLHDVIEVSNEPSARREAALALGLLRDPAVVARLRAIVQSKRTDLDRATAAICLGRVGDDADIDFLLGILAAKATSDPLRACVVRGLGLLLDREEGARFGRVVENGRWFRRVAGPDPFSDLRYLME